MTSVNKIILIKKKKILLKAKKMPITKNDLDKVWSKSN